MLKARRTQHKGLTNFSIVIYEKRFPPKGVSVGEGFYDWQTLRADIVKMHMQRSKIYNNNSTLQSAAVTVTFIYFFIIFLTDCMYEEF